jgi:2-polyprenyl-3-methyl-5-hydroxy-6-metoxy-1,4-benzoquinol methylase
MAGIETEPASGERRAGAVACPMCGGAAEFLLRTGDRNRLTTSEMFTYLRCSACATVFIERVPGDVSGYYRDSYYQFDESGEPTWRRDPARVAAAEWRVALLQRHLDGGHVIELGAGTGAFTLAARDAGFEVSAIEMSQACCDYLTGQRGITAICSDDPLASVGTLAPAQAVVFWHVLEHLADPVAVLRAAVERLVPGGVLAFAVPNPASLQFRVLKARWMHLDAPRHLRLAPPQALVATCQRLGLRAVELTTGDPDGRTSDLMSWINALNSPPALQGGSWLTGQLGGVAWRLATPVETRGMGSAVTLAFRK